MLNINSMKTGIKSLPIEVTKEIFLQEHVKNKLMILTLEKHLKYHMNRSTNVNIIFLFHTISSVIYVEYTLSLAYVIAANNCTIKM